MAKFQIKQIPAMVKNVVTEAKDHWHVPKPPNYVPYKEWLYNALAIGGEESITHTFPKYLSWGTGCFLLTLIYQIPLTYFAMIALLLSPLGYLWTIVNMHITDNLGHLPRRMTRIINAVYIPLFFVGLAMILFVPATAQETILPGFWKFIGVNIVVNIWSAWRGIFWRRLFLERLGRYKFWMYTNLIPYVVCIALILFVNYRDMPLIDRVWKLNFVFALYGMYPVHGQMGNLTDNMTPNEQERVRILALPGTAANGINSIWGFLVPALAASFGGVTSVSFLRWLLLPAFALAAVMMYLSVGKVKERIVQPPVEQKPEINFWVGFDAVLRNKYKWIQTVSSVVDTLGVGALSWQTVMFLYFLRETDWVYALLTTLLATAYTPGILFAPLINRLNYRTLYFLQRSLSIVTSAVPIVMLYFFHVQAPIPFAIAVLATGWFSTLISASMNSVINHNMNTNLHYYQMWISGERMEAFSGVFSWFALPFTTMMGFMIPVMYKNLGFASNWDTLYITDVRTNVLLAGCLIVILGDLASMIPYIWFKFSKKQYEQVIKDLAWRQQAGKDLVPVNEASRKGEDAEAVLAEVIAMRAARGDDDAMPHTGSFTEADA
ncbi:MAG: hypothetical protein LBR73_02340 [Oscillospiraceae bacterium]|jgi:Na+/melibiose symporter-like transporter|nr:hypothetical protein [Oscillospiraceae bacterium]